MEEEHEQYGECLKNQILLDGKIDGCQKFFSEEGGQNCDTCGCHQNYHRRIVRYVTEVEVVYTECHKMHRDGRGGYKDGCKEFVIMPSTGFTYTCAACSCHKSFHRNEIKTSKRVA